MISHFTIRLRKIYLDRYVCTRHEDARDGRL